MTLPATDPIALTQELIRCASVTPSDDGALSVVQNALENAGFECTRVPRGGIDNLFARWGEKGAARSFGFNGHTDVVPPGNPDDWTHGPFDGVIDDGVLFGRGACDMKSGVAAFAAAAIDFVRSSPPEGAVILTITGDEEGDGVDGTRALLDWMEAQGEAMTHCMVGEPTCPAVMGEMIKHGRRGSLTAHLTATGKQGHAAYPHRALNPLPALLGALGRLSARALDDGNSNFDASTLAITTVDTGNPASNVIPAQARATLNIRFNDTHSGASLSEWIHQVAAQVQEETGVAMQVQIKISGESFVTQPGWFTDLVANAVRDVCGVVPELSTSGGTSDARFVKDHCPVVEFGLVGQSMHQVDEHVQIDHITQLKSVYSRILERYFSADALG